jgi:hypothetical protein
VTAAEAADPMASAAAPTIARTDLRIQRLRYTPAA